MPEPMRFAYADPPYPGQAKRLYGDHPDYGGEVDHAALIARMVSDYPDGWALSTGAKWLQELLALSPGGVRVLAWVKTVVPPMSVRIQYSWEPVIVCGGRPWRKGIPLTVRDSLVCQPPVQGFVHRPDHIVGAKPARFARWVFECLGAESTDTLDDLFPGSGGIGREWAKFAGQPSLLEEAA
jgi:hypothetical protein